ncbi:hypothetical protein THA_789 [Thermosipho africanus TCF52B]|uniref:Uncharacterized protein n=1 Tax=Thermosipho africanus (strain TCF52B) TaxID=484019 RepID=B7IGN7_THEAB|nr:hypothetical protein THA_789 [Thermosipho africanus TCF52B]
MLFEKCIVIFLSVSLSGVSPMGGWGDGMVWCPCWLFHFFTFFQEGVLLLKHP